MRHLPMAALVGIALIVAGCGQREEPAPPPPPREEAPPVEQRDTAAERMAREAEARRRAEEAARRNRAALTEMVFFDYDAATIRDDQRAVLDAKVPILRENPSVQVRIEGHADERGSTEYNLALGERRAQAVKDYLVGFGLAGDRFETVSYGEERPLVRGSDEVSWARNRRAAFTITAGNVMQDR